ncbi:hypothetical protein H072_8510 [Dactylellina haptotyla CBS 200.50]|uniref:Uncharacterized protein n=1 Tax=Dactylellina haptotyla (strain CBS 200.50) TaxID=1284197 RepID=S8BRT1_DACHA|nr:hypothetical protein H072_8510 [Dactylellina haptotyla CBS 200.50]
MEHMEHGVWVPEANLKRIAITTPSIGRSEAVCSPNQDAICCIPAVDSGYASLESSTIDSTPTTPSPEPFSTDKTNVVTERTGEKPRLFNGRGFFLKQKAPKLLGFPDASVSEACYKRFEDLHHLFSDTIYKNLRPKYISWKPRILGEDEQRKRPYIVILCDPGSVKKLRRFFKTKEIRQQCEEAEGLPSLPVIVIASEPPFKLASLLNVFASVPTSSGSTTSGACIKIVHGDREKIATVGGIIKVVFGEETVLYGMTAGHVVNEIIDDDEEDSNPGDGGSLSSASEESETDFEFDEEYNTLPELDTTTIVNPDLVYSSAEVRISNPEWRPVGNILMPNDPVRGIEITGLDWALVEMTDRGWPTMNAVRREEDTSKIYKVQDGRVNNRPVIFKPGGESYYLRGNINTYASYVRSPSKHETRVYSMRCCADLDRVKSGDCGSWVIDAETGSVYGHIVAVDVFDEVHVVPLEDTIEEMKRLLGADEVCLPSPEDFIKVENRETYRATNLFAPFEDTFKERRPLYDAKPCCGEYDGKDYYDDYDDKVYSDDKVGLPSPEDLEVINRKTYRVPNLTKITDNENSLAAQQLVRQRDEGLANRKPLKKSPSFQDVIFAGSQLKDLLIREQYLEHRCCVKVYTYTTKTKSTAKHAYDLIKPWTCYKNLARQGVGLRLGVQMYFD